MTQDEINIELCKNMQKDIERVSFKLTSFIRNNEATIEHLREKHWEEIEKLKTRLNAYDCAVRSIKKGLASIAMVAILLLALFGLTMLVSGSCKAEEIQPNWKINNFQLLDVDKLSLEYAKIRNQRDGYYLVDDPHFDYRMAFLVNIRLLGYGYWQNDIHMMAADDRVRAVGWQWEAGAHILKNADVFWYHHSQHVMERESPRGQTYPLENRYGVRINFINK